MNLIRKFVFLLLATFVFVVALLAAADNSEEVALSFLDYQSPVWPLSWWMLLAFVIGVLFGTALNFVSNAKLRLNARAANKAVAHRNQELDQIKAEKSEMIPHEGNS